MTCEADRGKEANSTHIHTNVYDQTRPDQSES